jgi:uncharacterized membrane protein YgcG
VSPADFDELVGADLEPGERERLRRTHDLLVTAGAPPELPPSLRVPPGAPTPAEVRIFPGGYPRRRLAAAVVLAAAIAVTAFGAGYLTAEGSDPEPAFATDFVVPMRGTDAAAEARASLEVGERDEAGNWPMRMTVRNLPALPNLGRYELLLTKDGRLAASCGTFTVEGDKTVVFLNAPYRLRQYDTWVITREGSERLLLETVEEEGRPETSSDDDAAATQTGDDDAAATETGDDDGGNSGPGDGSDPDEPVDSSGSGSSGSGNSGGSGSNSGSGGGSSGSFGSSGSSGSNSGSGGNSGSGSDG